MSFMKLHSNKQAYGDETYSKFRDKLIIFFFYICSLNNVLCVCLAKIRFIDKSEANKF